MMNYMKYFGAFLVVLGVAVIFYAMFFASEVFLQGEPPPEVFKEGEVQLEEMLAPEEAEGELEMEAGFEDLVPVSDALNTVAVALFSVILIFAGGKLSSIGISILKGKE